ncbi:MAG: type II toxin-antitoxin system PemK/MazF family toxin [Gemmataceae bacterium]
MIVRACGQNPDLPARSASKGIIPLLALRAGRVLSASSLEGGGEYGISDIRRHVASRWQGDANASGTDRANPHSPHTIIVPFTTRLRQRLLPSHVFVPAGEGDLTQDSVALSEQIRVIDNDRLIRPLGALSSARLRDVDDALRTILEL